MYEDRFDPDKYEFYKKHKGDKVYWVDHWVSVGPNPEDVERPLGELLVSFDRKRLFSLWSDYPWRFTPEQKALFDKENPYWADFFRGRENDTPPPYDDSYNHGYNYDDNYDDPDDTNLL